MSRRLVQRSGPRLAIVSRPGELDQPTEVGGRTQLRPLIVAMRPRQWIKNLLVFAAPATAGLLGHPGVLARTSLAAAVFVVASSGTYLVNDVVDAANDRLHPVKRARPVASGALDPKLALGVALLFFAVAIAASGTIGGTALLSVVAAYVVVSVGYSLYEKRIAVIEMACVSSGFVLRAVAGGAAVHIPISNWFVLVTSAVALLVVAGKRSTELALLGTSAPSHRRVLEGYTDAFLRTVRNIASTVAIMSYALWAFERVGKLDFGHKDADEILFELSILPFVLGILVVERAIEAGEGGAPEELVLHSRLLQILGLTCIAFVMIGVYT